MFQIRVKDTNEEYTNINVSKDMKIKEVKEIYKNLTKNKPEGQYIFIFKTKKLDDEKKISDYKLKGNSVVSLLYVDDNIKAANLDNYLILFK